MTFALGAGDLFKLDKEGEFEETIISKCVDTYINVSASRHAGPPEPSRDGDLPTLATSFATGTNEANAAAALTSPTTPFSQSTLPSKSLLSRVSTADNALEHSVHQGKVGSTVLPDRATQDALQKVIERLFESCLREGRYRQVVGIAVEARNLEVLRRVIKRASDDSKKSNGKQVAGGPSGPAEELMEYMLDICMDVVQERSLRTEILTLILDLLNDIPTPDYFSIAKCVVYLNQDGEASTMLQKLVVRVWTQVFPIYPNTISNLLQEKEDSVSTAIAYQIAFDLYDNGTQEFSAKVINSLPAKVKEVAVEKENRTYCYCNEKHTR